MSDKIPYKKNANDSNRRGSFTSTFFVLQFLPVRIQLTAFYVYWQYC
jgi:hypothetical protein